MAAPHRLAAIDVGSNTVHLLVAEHDGARLVQVRHEVTLPRIGQVVAATGRVGAGKLREVVADVRRMAAVARESGAKTLLVGATDAVRRAGDAQAVLDAVSQAAGAPCRLISAEAEARLSFLGASSAHGGSSGETLVADIGGGSTECVLGSGAAVRALASLPIGSGTATDRWLQSDPPAAAERAACRQAVAKVMTQAPAGRPRRGIATGGTVTTLPRLLGRDESGDLDAGDIDRCRAVLDAEPSAALAARLGIEPVRCRVLAGGVEIVAAVMRRYGLPRLRVSSAGVRDGMILAWLRGGERWAEG